MDSIVWAIKHTMRDIAELGLNRMKYHILHLYTNLTHSSLSRGRKQFRQCRRSGNHERILPTILPQSPPRRLLCLDRH